MLHQVPDGFTTILKSIWVNNAETTVNPIQVFCRPLAGQPDIYVMTPSLASAAGLEQLLWIVLEEGDTLIARSLGGAFRIWASGAILPNVP